MKLINIVCMLFLSSTVMLSCKSNQSGLEYVSTKYGDAYYLLGIAYGNKTSEVICRFKCDTDPEKIENRTTCKDPHYVLTSSLPSYSVLNALYKDINDENTITKEIDKNIQNELNSTFFDTETNEIEGTPTLVCKDILESERSTNLVTYTKGQSSDVDLNKNNLTAEYLTEKIKEIDNNENNSKSIVKTKVDKVFRDQNTFKYWTLYGDVPEVYKEVESVQGLTQISFSDQLKSSCETLNINKISGKWRLPTIVELYALYKHGGSTMISGNKNVISDSWNGVKLWRLNFKTGKPSVVYKENQSVNVLCVNNTKGEIK